MNPTVETPTRVKITMPQEVASPPVAPPAAVMRAIAARAVTRKCLFTLGIEGANHTACQATMTSLFLMMRNVAAPDYDTSDGWAEAYAAVNGVDWENVGYTTPGHMEHLGRLIEAVANWRDPAAFEQAIQGEMLEPFGTSIVNREFSAAADPAAPQTARAVLEQPLIPAGTAPPELWTNAIDSVTQRLREARDRTGVRRLKVLLSGGERHWKPVWIELGVDHNVDTAKKVSLWMLSDQPLESDRDDRLGFRAYAHALTSLIVDPRTATPLTIAINGEWGSGKSTLARMVERGVRDPGNGSAKHITCWFNAWMHDDATDIGAAFASTVAQEADLHRGELRRTFSPLPAPLLNRRERVWRNFYRLTLLFGAVVPVTLLLANVTPIVIPAVPITTETQFGVATLFLTTAFALLRYYMEAAKTLSAFVSNPKTAAQKGSIDEVRKQLRNLISSATRKGQRFVIFVDDLERCRPPRAVDLLEVVNQLISHPNVVTVVLADLSAVAAAAEVKYQDLVKVYALENGDDDKTYRIGSYGRRYLQKIIQLQFDLPAHTRAKIMELVNRIMAEPDPPPARRDNRFKRFTQNSNLRLREVLTSFRANARTAARAAGRFVERTYLVLMVGALEVLYVMREGFPAPSQIQVAVTMVVAAIMAIALQRQKNEERRAQRDARVVENADRLIRDGVDNAEDLRRRLQQSEPGVTVSDTFLSQRLIQSVVSSDSKHWIAAVDEAIAHFPARPRNVKRLLNRLRLLLSIAYERGMLERRPRQTARLIGRWTVLWERWPEIAHEVSERIGVMHDLEDAAARDDDSFVKLVRRLAPVHAEDTELREFCLRVPRLSSLVEAIIYLDRNVRPRPRKARS